MKFFIILGDGYWLRSYQNTPFCSVEESADDLYMEVHEEGRKMKKTKKKISMQEPNKKTKHNNVLCPLLICETNCGSASNKNGFYKLPEDPAKREEWIKACKFPSNVENNVMICWKHFQTSDFETEMDHKFINMVIELGRRISLKKTALPSQLLPLHQVDFKLKEKITVKEKYSEVKAEMCFDADGAPILQSTLLVFSKFAKVITNKNL